LTGRNSKIAQSSTAVDLETIHHVKENIMTIFSCVYTKETMAHCLKYKVYHGQVLCSTMVLL